MQRYYIKLLKLVSLSKNFTKKCTFFIKGGSLLLTCSFFISAKCVFEIKKEQAIDEVKREKELDVFKR